MAEFASNGKANAGLTTGIIGTGRRKKPIFRRVTTSVPKRNRRSLQKISAFSVFVPGWKSYTAKQTGSLRHSIEKQKVFTSGLELQI